MEDPQQCHTHSEIPDEWPPLGEILDYQERVRARVRSILEMENLSHDRCLGEALWIGFEHEVMHLETFLYMLLQSEKTLPPLVERPDFEGMFHQARKEVKPNEWFSIPEQTLSVGLDDSDENTVPEDSFGWDNEKPSRTVSVHAFEAQGRPITNGEYAKYLQANNLRKMPASWGLTHGNDDYPIPQAVNGSSGHATEDFISNFAVRTVFGPVPLEFAQDWPLFASYDELSEYAEWTGYRIPTFEEAKSIYNYSAQLKEEKQHDMANCHRLVCNIYNITLATSLTAATATKRMESRTEAVTPSIIPINLAPPITSQYSPFPKTPCRCLLISTIRTLVSDTGTQLPSSKMAINSPARVKWEASGNGLARRLCLMMDSRLWRSIRDILVSAQSPETVPQSGSRANLK